MILKYFETGNITQNGTVVCDGFTTKQRHIMVKKIFASSTISQSSKDEVMAALEQIDSSDLLGQTKAYCQAVIPDLKNKQDVWERLFSEEKKEEMGLYVQ